MITTNKFQTPYCFQFYRVVTLTNTSESEQPLLHAVGGDSFGRRFRRMPRNWFPLASLIREIQTMRYKHLISMALASPIAPASLKQERSPELLIYSIALLLNQ